MMLGFAKTARALAILGVIGLLPASCWLKLPII